jgi:DNA-binding PucR family transcriptional regulator
VLDLRQLGLAAYLLRTGTTAALRSFADTLVRPLEEYDARKKAQLCATVRTWLDVGASVPAAAKALIVHPNTVAYRLTRAEQLLRRDLRTTATRMELQLAFTVRDVQRARGPA